MWDVGDLIGVVDWDFFGDLEWWLVGDLDFVFGLFGGDLLWVGFFDFVGFLIGFFEWWFLFLFVGDLWFFIK